MIRQTALLIGSGLVAAIFHAALLFGSLAASKALGFREGIGAILGDLAVLLSPIGAGVVFFVFFWIVSYALACAITRIKSPAGHGS